MIVLMNYMMNYARNKMRTLIERSTHYTTHISDCPCGTTPNRYVEKFNEFLSHYWVECPNCGRSFQSPYEVSSIDGWNFSIESITWWGKTKVERNESFYDKIKARLGRVVKRLVKKL